MASVCVRPVSKVKRVRKRQRATRKLALLAGARSVRSRVAPPTAAHIAQDLLVRGQTFASARSVRRDLGPRRHVVRQYRQAAAQRRRRALLEQAERNGGWS